MKASKQEKVFKVGAETFAEQSESKEGEVTLTHLGVLCRQFLSMLFSGFAAFVPFCSSDLPNL